MCILAFVQQQLFQVEQSHSKLAQPFRRNTGYKITVMTICRCDHHSDVVAANRVARLENLRAIVIIQRGAVTNGFHFASDPQCARISKPVNGHHDMRGRCYLLNVCWMRPAPASNRTEQITQRLNLGNFMACSESRLSAWTDNPRARHSVTLNFFAFWIDSTAASENRRESRDMFVPAEKLLRSAVIFLAPGYRRTSPSGHWLSIVHFAIWIPALPP